MTIANEITRINNAKAAIKEAIINKGVTVSDTAKLDEYPALINSITVGSGGEGSGSCNSYFPEFFELRTNNYTDLQYIFAYITILEEDIATKSLIENFDTSKVTNFKYAFNAFGNAYTSKEKLKELDLTKWNVSKGTDFQHMFSLCKVPNINISGLDFSKAGTSGLYYFSNAGDMETVNMSNCNTSIISNFSYFMYSNSNLTSINMTGCDTSKATNMNSMFSGDKKLVSIIGELDTSSLSNGLYPSSSANPFYNCTSLETVYIKNIYKDIAVTNVAKFSINLGTTKVKDECLIYIINELPDLINDKGLTATDKIIFTLPTTNTLTAEQVQPAIDKGWTCANIATASATYGLRRRMFYKAVECEEGAYQASDGSRYEIFEANNVVTPDGVADWDEFASIEDASEYYGLTYIGEQEDGQ